MVALAIVTSLACSRPRGGGSTPPPAASASAATSATTSDANAERDIRGRITAVDAAQGVVTLDHEAIPGVMAAMTMEYSVSDPRLLEGLKVGDPVQGRLRVKGYVITALHRR